MKQTTAILLVGVMAAALAFTAATITTTEPADAHTVTGCQLRQVKGSYNWTWSSDTYSNHSSPTNCEVQSKLARKRGGSRVWKYGSWGIIKSYVFSNADSVWYGSGRNCARIKVPSTGYKSSWACAN